jgi:hypothetical protein
LKESYQNHVFYGNKHNYDVVFDFHDYMQDLNVSLPGQWNKVASLKRYIGEYDWILWLDVDCFVKDFNRSLDDLLDKAERHDLHVILPNDFDIFTYTFSNFAFLIRGSYWGTRLVDLWYENGIFGECRWPDPSTGKAEGWMATDQPHMWIAIIQLAAEYSGLKADCLNQCGAVHPSVCTNGFFRNERWPGTELSQEVWTLRPPVLWTVMNANSTGLAVQAAWGPFAESRNMFDNAFLFHAKSHQTFYKWYEAEISQQVQLSV